jgi:hypothetical protein
MILENGYCRNRQENIGNCWNMKAYQLVRKFLLRADSIKKKGIILERTQKTDYDDQIFMEGYFQVPSKDL